MAAEVRLTPDNIDKYISNVRIETSGGKSVVGFRVYVTGDTYNSMLYTRGRLEVREEERLVARSRVCPEVYDGEVVYYFDMQRQYVPNSVFKLLVNAHYRIELDDWFPADSPLSISWEVESSSVTQGDTIKVSARVVSPVSRVLSFGSTCQSGYTLFNADGSKAYQESGMCGQMITSIRIEKNRETTFCYSVPTYYSEDVESEKLRNGYLPVGEYRLSCYVLGYQFMGLDRKFEIEVVER